jgi:hypothetical protein
MPRMHILTPAEYATFETPPVFTTLERQRFFDLSPSLEHLLSKPGQHLRYTSAEIK